jgi:hypothetical protein
MIGFSNGLIPRTIYLTKLWHFFSAKKEKRVLFVLFPWSFFGFHKSFLRAKPLPAVIFESFLKVLKAANKIMGRINDEKNYKYSEYLLSDIITTPLRGWYSRRFYWL